MTDHAYERSDHAAAKSWKRIHGNAEETHVVIVALNGDYMGVAMDVAPAEWELQAAELLCYEPTAGAAEQKTETWLHNNPKGVLGGGGSDGESKAMEIGKKVFNALDQSANQELDSMQDQ